MSHKCTEQISTFNQYLYILLMKYKLWTSVNFRVNYRSYFSVYKNTNFTYENKTIIWDLNSVMSIETINIWTVIGNKYCFKNIYNCPLSIVYMTCLTELIAL